MSLGAETGSLTFGFLCTCVLKENGTICQLPFQYRRGKLHTETAHPIPGGRHISAFADALLGSLGLEAAGCWHCPPYSANQRWEGGREAFSIHFSHPAICHDLRDGTPAFVKAAETSCLGTLCSGCSLLWDGSHLAESLWRVWREENQRLLCLRSHISSDDAEWFWEWKR